MISNKIAKYATTAGLFITVPSILGWFSTVRILDVIAEWLKNISGNSSSEGNENSGNEHENQHSGDGNTGNTPSTPPTQPSVPEGLKRYDGSSKDVSPNGYSDFNVVDGFDDSLAHSQFEYDTYYTNSSGQRKNGGCTSVSDSIVYALNHDTEFPNPENSWKNGQTYWTTQSIRSNENLGAQDRLNEVYNQIVNKGNAVVVRVTNHSMAAVGIKEGADPNNVTPADILVCDSGYTNTGRICTLQEYLDAHPGREVHGGSGYALRI